MKLKLGEIEMDSAGGISFGGGSDAGGPAGAAQQQSRPAASSNSADQMHRLLNWPRRAYVLFAALAVLGALGLVAGVAVSGGTLGLLPLMPVPGLLLAAGLALWRAAKAGRAPASAEPVDVSRGDQLASHLLERGEPASVEELIEELGWREDAVVLGLKAAVERDLVEEDLDLDSGHWRYAAAAPNSDEQRHVLPIEERAERLTSDEDQFSPTPHKRSKS